MNNDYESLLNDIEVEKTILGCCLMDLGHSLKKCIKFDITPSHFYYKKN